MDYRPPIVVVEDEATQRQLLVECLGKQSFRVTGVGGAPALHRLVDRELPTLVLLDVGLPDEDGFALARLVEVEHTEEIADCRHLLGHVGMAGIHLRIGKIVAAARSQLAEVPVALNELHDRGVVVVAVHDLTATREG